MKINKKIFLAISITVFMVAAWFLIEPVEVKDVGPDDSKEVAKLEKELNDFKIDYLNLKENNQILEQENENLENYLFESVFNLKKLIYDSEHIIDFLPHPKTTEILYKDIGETEYVLLYRDETGINMLVSSKEEKYVKNLSIQSLNPEDGISLGTVTDPEHYTLFGVITNRDIKDVQVLVNDNMYESNIFQIKENVSVRYKIIEYERKSHSEYPDKIKIEAIDKNGTILWEESFDGDRWS